MYGCLTSSRYAMSADIYRQYKTQNATGQVVRSWQFIDNVKGHAASMNAASRTFTGAEKWENIYEFTDSVMFKTAAAEVQMGDRITNIKDTNGKLLWEESADVPTVFDIIGIAPLTDPFGAFVEYRIILNRSEVQTVG